MKKGNKFAIGFLMFLFLGMISFAGGIQHRIKVPFDSGNVLPKPYAEGEVIVKFKKGVSFDAVNKVAVQNTMTVQKHFRTLSRLSGGEFVVLKSSTMSSLEMLNTLKGNPAVALVSLNRLNEIAASPNDTSFSSLWGMHNTTQTGGTFDADIDAPEAWDISTGSASNIVAVIDTGLDYTHPDLAANAWLNPGEIAGNGVDDDGNGYVDDIYGIDPAGVDGSTPDTDPMDGYGHGTHCAGTIGAVGNNSLGVAGVNWTVRIMGLKFFDDAGGNAYDSFAIECMDYAIDQKVNHGQNIVAINASWGSFSTDGDPGPGVDALRDAIETVNDNGIVFCAASGNGNGDADAAGDNNDTEIHHYPSDYTLPGIISVTATDHNDALGSFANFGPTSVDLGAPGVDILSTVPGAYIPQSGDVFFDNCNNNTAGNWVTSGTNNSWAVTAEYEVYWGGVYPSAPSPAGFWSDRPGVGGAYTFYLPNTDSYLTYNTDIDLSAYVGQELYYGMWIGRHIGTGDYLYLDFSADSGATWTSFTNWPATGGSVYFWAKYVWLIPDAFKTAHFRMRYHLVTNASSNGIGTVIDDIGIGTTITYSYESWDGTSMATPHVAGAIGLMASVFPTETVAQRKARILDWGDSIPALGGITVTGKRLNLFNSISYSYVPQSIAVTSPDGGESWAVGTAHDITWTSAGSVPVGNVNIDYSTNGGTDWISIATGTDNDGTYSWTVPSTPSTTCLVRIQEADGSPSDQSNAVFSIITAAETVSTPTTPTGPASGAISTSYDYSTGGSTSSLGHNVQYLFDWDDGSDSGWLAVGTTTASHSWAAAGTYHVRAMARCESHTGIESAWSTTLEVVISSGPTGYYNSPAQQLILPEVNWALAATGGTWVSEVHIIDVTGGSTVQAYYNSGTTRRGPFTLWTNAGGVGSSTSFSNVLETLSGLDAGFTYYGTSGALELVTQDGSHKLQASSRTYNGNYSRTFPALVDTDTNTAASGRSLVISNISYDGTYRPSVVLYNPSTDSVTAGVTVLGADGSTVATTSRTLAGHEMSVVTSELRVGSYSNATIEVEVTAGSGRVLASGQTANNTTSDPAAHLAVQSGSGYANSPAQQVILPEVNWALASTGGTWISEVQLVDITGGSTVQAYYNSGTTRRGPFTLWTNAGGAGSSTSFSNILETLSGLDAGFTYYGTSGALELVTQDGSHMLQASSRTYNGDYSRTFPALVDTEAATAASGRSLVISNISYDGTYRPSVVLYNPSADSVTVAVTVLGGDGSTTLTTSRTLAGHEMSVITSELRVGSYSNATVLVEVTAGSGRVLASGQTANNTTSDPAAHLAVQGQ